MIVRKPVDKIEVNPLYSYPDLVIKLKPLIHELSLSHGVSLYLSVP